MAERDLSGELHVIVGAGSVGTAVAEELLHRGARVRVLTRSGGGLDRPGVERIAGDASDAEAVARHTVTAAAIYNCANPPYHRWAQEWPPLAAALLGAARQHGAVLATVSNLYGYGPVSAPMTEQTPLAATGTKGKVRAQMWLTALAAHQAGEVRGTEARGSDYLGRGSQSQLGAQALKALRAGKTVRVLGDPDVLHTWTFTLDMARTLVTAANHPDGLGRAWHVPSNEPKTVRDVVADLAGVEGVATVDVKRLSPFMIKAGALVVPILRELPEVEHQHTRPWIMDSTEAQDTLSLKPTPWPDILAHHLSPTPAR